MSNVVFSLQVNIRICEVFACVRAILLDAVQDDRRPTATSSPASRARC